MTSEEKKALVNIKNELYNYPEMMMVTISRKDLEIIINYLEKENKKLNQVKF